MSKYCHPNCIQARNKQKDYDASQHVALVAVHLISSARLLLNLDTEFTEYSAQFLVDNAGRKVEDVLGEMDQQHCEFTYENILKYLEDNLHNPKKEDGQGEMDQQRCELTVKDCLQFALKVGLPKAEHWAHLGCTFKPPPFACHIARVPMKGEVIEATNLEEALELLRQHELPVGARLYVFSPDIDRVGDGIYKGPSGRSRYVGLRDVIIVGAERTEEDFTVDVQICYMKKTSFVKVSALRRFMRFPLNGDDDSRVIEPTGLLVDFCLPRLSIN